MKVVLIPIGCYFRSILFGNLQPWRTFPTPKAFKPGGFFAPPPNVGVDDLLPTGKISDGCEEPDVITKELLLMNKKQDKLLTTFEEAILLAIGDDYIHGWDIMKKINKSLNKEGYSFGTLYPALKRLRDRGWIESSVDAEPKKGKKKQLYKITDAGREALLEIENFRRSLSNPSAEENDENYLNKGQLVFAFN